MAEAIKVTVEKESQKITAFCDTDCFVKGDCALEWDKCDICCVLCDYALDCGVRCERIKEQ